MKAIYRFLGTLLAVILIIGFMPTITAQAASNDDNVEWSGAGHLPGSNVCGIEALNYRYPPANPSSAQSVVVRARSYQFDLTGITLWYTTNPSAAVQGDWASVGMVWALRHGV
jgi:hypothetical protein